MNHYKIIIIFVGIFLSSCYFKLSHKLNELNPTEYYFDAPISQVRKTIRDTLCCIKRQNMSIHPYLFEYRSTFFQTFVEENRNMFSFGDLLLSSGKSQMYYNWWGRLALYSRFTIKLDSISMNKTKIKIESITRVKTGLTFSTNHGIPYIIPYTQDVKSSTIEEYQIIKTIGEALGQKNMPDVNYAIKKRN